MDSVTTTIAPATHDKTPEQYLLTELILARLPHFGPASYWALQKQFKSAHTILQPGFNIDNVKLKAETKDCIRELQKQKNNHPLFNQAQKDLNWLQENNVKALTHTDENYPALLKATDNPPPILFIKGELTNLSLPQIAIVGSRSPSPAGRENALRFAEQLAAMGFTITSGLALGIDAAAHNGAIKNSGKTIAVMGTGIDRIYPISHRTLAKDIVAKGGTIITEFPLGSTPQASHFPRRNRIISGLSLGVLVIEAAVKSGSLITARYALQQNREVFSVPGSIHNPLSRGCHALLREGAILVESVEDLYEPLQGLLQFHQQQLATEKNRHSQINLISESKKQNVLVTSEEQHLLNQLGYEICSVDFLQQNTGINPGTLLSLLMSLEIKGLIANSNGGYQRLPNR